jgi:uncharacterized protein YecE (DUF72 family)
MNINNDVVNRPLYFIGTSGWTYDHWKGHFYPEELPRRSWFEYYANLFSSVEVNATFYGFFKNQTYLKWRNQAPQGFGYVLKAPRLITHRKHLLDVKENIQSFYQSCMLLEEKFEMILLQISPATPFDQERLRQALQLFPDPTRVAVEFRRSEWLNTDVMELLRKLGATICNVDSPQQQITDFLTTNRAYLRLHGRKHWYSYNYSADELKDIAALARQLGKNGAERIYIFFNNDFEGYAPANALLLKKFLLE